MESERKFSTLEIYPATYLLVKGIEIDLEPVRGRQVFTCDASDEVYRLLAEYNSNADIGVIDFVSALKTLKARLYAAKEGQGESARGNR